MPVPERDPCKLLYAGRSSIASGRSFSTSPKSCSTAGQVWPPIIIDSGSTFVGHFPKVFPNPTKLWRLRPKLSDWETLPGETSDENMCVGRPTSTRCFAFVEFRQAVDKFRPRLSDTREVVADAGQVQLDLFCRPGAYSKIALGGFSNLGSPPPPPNPGHLVEWTIVSLC